MVFNISTQNPPKNAFSMPSNAVFPMPPAFGICLIFNAVGIADAVTPLNHDCSFVPVGKSINRSQLIGDNS